MFIYMFTHGFAVLKQRGAKYYENYMRNRKLRGGEFIGPPLGPALLQQQQQQQQQQQCSPADLSALSPEGFRSLLDQCLLATAPGPVSIADLPAFAGAGTTQQQQQQRGDLTERSATTAPQQQQQQQLLRQPWQFQDYVPADLAKQLLPALKRKRGVTVHTPELSTSKYVSFLLPACLFACLLVCLFACFLARVLLTKQACYLRLAQYA
jgi:hypothetical protein